MPVLTYERLRQCLRYEPDTGYFIWLITKGPKKPVGSIAGTNKGGYIRIGIDGRLYHAHRLAWLYMTGEWPDNLVDHRDTDPSNNAWKNLRKATHEQNSHNCKMHRHNTTGVKGVSKHRGKFRAYVKVKGKFIHLGIRDTKEEAEALANEGRERFHGEFRRDR